MNPIFTISTIYLEMWLLYMSLMEGFQWRMRPVCTPWPTPECTLPRPNLIPWRSVLTWLGDPWLGHISNVWALRRLNCNEAWELTLNCLHQTEITNNGKTVWNAHWKRGYSSTANSVQSSASDSHTIDGWFLWCWFHQLCNTPAVTWFLN